jgi:hypothetical protein
LPVQASGAHGHGHCGSDIGQAQEPAEQPGTAGRTYQDCQAARVHMAHQRHIEDESASGRAEKPDELLAQDWCARDVERTAQDRNSAGIFGPDEKGRTITSAGNGGGHATPIGLTARWRADTRDHLLTCFSLLNPSRRELQRWPQPDSRPK